MEGDAFLTFVESARRMLLQSAHASHPPEHLQAAAHEDETSGPSWAWVFCRILDCLKAYSSGVTPAILLSDLLKVCRVFVKDIKLDQIRQEPNHEHFVNKDVCQGSAYAGGCSRNAAPSIIMTLELYDRPTTGMEK